MIDKIESQFREYGISDLERITLPPCCVRLITEGETAAAGQIVRILCIDEEIYRSELQAFGGNPEEKNPFSAPEEQKEEFSCLEVARRCLKNREDFCRACRYAPNHRYEKDCEKAEMVLAFADELGEKAEKLLCHKIDVRSLYNRLGVKMPVEEVDQLCYPALKIQYRKDAKCENHEFLEDTVFSEILEMAQTYFPEEPVSDREMQQAYQLLLDANRNPLSMYRTGISAIPFHSDRVEMVEEEIPAGVFLNRRRVFLMYGYCCDQEEYGALFQGKNMQLSFLRFENVSFLSGLLKSRNIKKMMEHPEVLYWACRRYQKKDDPFKPKNFVAPSEEIFLKWWKQEDETSEVVRKQDVRQSKTIQGIFRAMESAPDEEIEQKTEHCKERAEGEYVVGYNLFCCGVSPEEEAPIVTLQEGRYRYRRFEQKKLKSRFPAMCFLRFTFVDLAHFSDVLSEKVRMEFLSELHRKGLDWSKRCILVGIGSWDVTFVCPKSSEKKLHDMVYLIVKKIWQNHGVEGLHTMVERL